jgi:hypothetical protein
MRKLIIAAIIGFVTCAAFAQSDEKKEEKTKTPPVVPAVVTQAFAKDFPSTNATWDAEDGNFEANFKVKGTETSATYNSSGHRLETEMEMKVSDLPASVVTYVSTNYHGYKVSEAAKMTDDKNVVTYEAEISKDGHSMDLIFDATGKYLRQGTVEKD